MIRVVFDTNVFVSAIVFGGLPRELLVTALDGGFRLCISPPILTEINRVLRDKFNHEPAALELVNREINALCHRVQPTERIAACRDPADNCVLECATSARADYIVTGDRHLLEMHPFRGVPVLSPAGFWSLRPWERQ